MDSIPSEIIGIIISNLRPIDNIMLSMSAPRYTQFYPNFSELITEFLRTRVNINIDEFFSLLERTGGYLSGSCILQVLYNEDWSNENNSDIDIIIRVPKDTLISDNLSISNFSKYSSFLESPSCLFMKDYYYGSPDPDPNHWDSSLYSPLLRAGYSEGVDELEPQLIDFHTKYNRYGFLPAAPTKFYHKTNPGTFIPINIIYVEDHIPFYVDYYFDFSVCKVLFDGHKLMIKDPIGILKRITTNNINYDRYNRQCAINCASLLNCKSLNVNNIITDQANKRKHKYMQRGFEIIDKL
jgi:hypothetical protein